MTYSFTRCVCGARLAYWHEAGPRAWDCADVLLGNVGTVEDKAIVGEPPILGMGEPLPDKKDGKWVHRRLPFAFWKAKSDHGAHGPRD